MNFRKELLKNVLFKGINVLLSFVITVLMVRLLGAEGNGFYSLFIANTAIIALVISFSLNSGITYYTAKKEFPVVTLLNTLVLILFAQLILILVAEKIFFSIFGFSIFADTNLSGLTFWGCIYLEAIFLSGYLTAIFTGNKWFDTLNILTTITNIIFIIVFSYLLLKNRTPGFENTIFILKIYIFLIAFQALLILSILLKRIRFKFRFSFLKSHQVSKILTYAGIAFFCNFFQFLAYRMDYWFIDFFRNKEELGLYALASKLNQVLWMIPITIAAVIVPFAVTNSAEVMQKVKTILRLLINGYILLGIILAILSPGLIPFVFGNSFSGTVIPFIILLPGVIIFSITTLLAAYFAGINRQDINLKISIFCFLIILTGDSILVPQLGMKGAAIASCIGYAFSGFYSLTVFSNQSGWNFKELLLVRKEDMVSVKNIFADKITANE
jgi:O-antigen/teichoic acid export membrane protein